MNNWEEGLKAFYQEQQAILEKNYPGLKYQRIIDLVRELAPIGNFTCEQLQILKDKLREGIPLQYISSQTFFYKMNFYVDERVLIPRSESEIMVEQIVMFFQKNPSRNTLLEMGVGSGALILSVLSEISRPLKAIATDISFSALEVTKLNLEQKRFKFHLQTELNLFWADRLIGLTSKVDVLYSNPPYIKHSDDYLVHDQVKQFEPHQALFLADEVYDQWFTELFKQAQDLLLPGGFFMMEGHENHLPKLQEKLAGFDFTDVKLVRDYTARNRFITAYRK